RRIVRAVVVKTGQFETIAAETDCDVAARDIGREHGAEIGVAVAALRNQRDIALLGGPVSRKIADPGSAAIARNELCRAARTDVDIAGGVAAAGRAHARIADGRVEAPAAVENNAV